MKILIDMNLSPRWCDYFKKEDIEAVHWSDVGQLSAPDIEIFNYAYNNEYIIFTHDLDFSVLLALTNSDGPSVIQLRTHDTLPERIFNRVYSAITSNEKDLHSGAIVTINLITSRVKTLPLHA